MVIVDTVHRFWDVDKYINNLFGGIGYLYIYQRPLFTNYEK